MVMNKRFSETLKALTGESEPEAKEADKKSSIVDPSSI